MMTSPDPVLTHWYHTVFLLYVYIMMPLVYCPACGVFILICFRLALSVLLSVSRL